MAGNRRVYDASMKRAESLVREAEWAAAIPAYSEALSEYPGDLVALTGLGLTYGWLSPVGPLECTVMWGSERQDLLTHLNIGYLF